MCTVTYIPTTNGAIITSNRDEHISRGIALYPVFYSMGNKMLAYPKDSKAGGTWFICNEQGDTGVLLNGAFEKHTPTPPYRKSRGMVLPEIFQNYSPLNAIQHYDLAGIENFTIILWEQGLLYEIKWDGLQLFIKNHAPQKAHIWSSVTLYSGKMISERHGWFESWLQVNQSMTQEDIVHFHSNTGADNKEYGLKISRENAIATSSITSAAIENKKTVFLHKDLIQHIDTVLEYDLKPIPSNYLSSINHSEIAQKN